MSIRLLKNLRVLVPCLATTAIIVGVWLADLPSLHMGRVTVAAEGQQSQIPQDEFEQRVRNYLLAYPEVVGEALSRLEAKQGELQAAAEAALKSHEAEVFQDPDSPVGGNPNGNVTLVEFFDYNCPYCRAMTPVMAKAEAADPQLRIVYKEFPILGQDSVFAAKAALAANKQGKYVAFHRALYQVRGQIDEAKVIEVAASVGLDVSRLKSNMQDAAINAMLAKNLKLAQTLQINGTPVFVTANEVKTGAMDLKACKP
ncbi:DsbA family protein [Bradyrhizobium sp. 61]|uniref:DsbA family protein n=1 Tax=Bradyrhizobium sp. 61 TaxID=2782679 RepID=UPI001FF98D69|nr:DsbA family protein [Bradyrhizobium sp. 61]MCK1277379.1 DsbA family protein [Bradyrhizobium sp. 61]